MTTQRVIPLISIDIADFLIPGVQISLSPEEADAAGAFVEDAMSYEDAWAANGDPSEFSDDAVMSPRRDRVSATLRAV